jgi:hypothetical protein
MPTHFNRPAINGTGGFNQAQTSGYLSYREDIPRASASAYAVKGGVIQHDIIF